ncbi:FAD-binding domain protein [Colletotrichum truncatum]|uniref:FAD-binding domain protein n=1 Tax=Colletotrichum truncatum TaxID=5467 RepID=A0ACC3Z204_COLTU|nr:FAD-binding domain protein [Colletotrichum truncatum]KAF6780909.1 FAD-binding domain protein [Colletotrichum truncatum]
MTIVEKNTITIDGVTQGSQTGIQVIVVGAGIGGLMTALECWRKGHKVIVLEKAEELSVMGDVIVIGPSAWVTIDKYPSMADDYEKLKHDVLFSFKSQQGELLLGPQEIEWNWPGVAQHASHPRRIAGITSRRDIAEMLYNQVRRLGIEAKFSTHIVQFAENNDEGVAIARSSDGHEFIGDVVVAADGLGTKSHAVVLGQEVKAIASGYVCVRGSFPTAAVQGVASVQALLPKAGERPKILAYTGVGTHLILTLTHKTICVALTSEDDGTAEESWSKTISGSTIANRLSTADWDPAVVDCFKNAPDGHIVSWKLCWRDPQPKWTSAGSRIIQLGDSAHSFLPTSANGGTMAAEDALSLAECLRISGKSKVPLATKVHEALRYQRVSLVQKTGFVNRREMHRDMKTITQDGNRPMLQGKWIWTHNPELYATNNYEAAKSAIEAGGQFKNTNLPPGHIWEPWTMSQELEKEASGVFVQDLKTNGDWGVLA